MIDPDVAQQIEQLRTSLRSARRLAIAAAATGLVAIAASVSGPSRIKAQDAQKHSIEAREVLAGTVTAYRFLLMDSSGKGRVEIGTDEKTGEASISVIGPNDRSASITAGNASTDFVVRDKGGRTAAKLGVGHIGDNPTISALYLERPGGYFQAVLPENAPGEVRSVTKGKTTILLPPAAP